MNATKRLTVNEELRVMNQATDERCKRLCDAAPEMLEALKKIADIRNGSDSLDACIRIAEKAIALATHPSEVSR